MSSFELKSGKRFVRKAKRMMPADQMSRAVRSRGSSTSLQSQLSRNFCVCLQEIYKLTCGLVLAFQKDFRCTEATRTSPVGAYGRPEQMITRSVIRRRIHTERRDLAANL